MSSLFHRAPRALVAKVLTLLTVLTAGFVLVTGSALPSSAAESVAGKPKPPPPGEVTERVQFQRGITLSPGTFGPTRFPFYDVPDGKRLVVEQMTGHS